MNASMLFVVIAFGIALCVAAVFLWFLRSTHCGFQAEMSVVRANIIVHERVAITIVNRTGCCAGTSATRKNTILLDFHKRVLSGHEGPAKEEIAGCCGGIGGLGGSGFHGMARRCWVGYLQRLVRSP